MKQLKFEKYKELMNYSLIFGISLIKQSLEFLLNIEKLTRHRKRQIRRVLDSIIPEIIIRCQIGKRLTRMDPNMNKLLHDWLLDRREVIFHILKPVTKKSPIFSNENEIINYALIIGTFLIIHSLNNIIGHTERLTRSQRRPMDTLTLDVFPKLVWNYIDIKWLFNDKQNYQRALQKIFKTQKK